MACVFLVFAAALAFLGSIPSDTNLRNSTKLARACFNVSSGKAPNVIGIRRRSPGNRKQNNQLFAPVVRTLRYKPLRS